MIRFVITLWLCFILGGMYAQGTIGIGEWQALLPYTGGSHIAESPDWIFYSSDQSLLRFDKNTLEETLITTTEGLHDINTNLISYNEAANALVVTYENSNIDIIYEDEIINIPDIRLDNSIQADKSIRNIYQEGQLTFLACGFGIVVLDLQNGVIQRTAITPEVVLDITRYEDDYLAIMDGRLFRFPVNDFNRFEFWNLWVETNSPYSFGTDLRQIEVFESKCYASNERNLYQYNPESGTDTLIQGNDNLAIAFLQKGRSSVLVGLNRSNAEDYVRYYFPDGRIVDGGFCHGILTYAWEADNGRVFFGDQFGGFRYAEGIEGSCEIKFFNSPAFARSSDIDVRNGVVAIAGGGPTSNFGYGFSSNGFYLLSDSSWTNINPILTPAMRNPDVYDVFRIAIHPSDGSIYAGTYWTGIIRYDGETIQRFDKTNSCLEGAIGDTARERITGLAFDAREDLWISNFASPNALKVFRADGSCESYSTPGSNQLADLAIDRDGLVWARVAGNNSGLLVFDQGDPSNVSDDRFRFITSSNSALSPGEVTAIASDREGGIWVGTSDGMYVFSCGRSIFEFDCSSQPIVDDDGDGVGDFLLEDVRVNAIAVDGADRKWVGTDGGILVLSPSGDEELFAFTKENSPLFDNRITALGYDMESGVMYIGTAQGVIAYRTRATKGRSITESNAYAFPNPVRPEYTGPIAIKGVAEDAFVKITDTEGRVLFETESFGGQAIWDGTQWNGERVASGVYLAWITSQTDFVRPNTAVVKIVVIH